MRMKSPIWSILLISLTLSLNASADGLGSLQDFKDAYPDRELLLKKTVSLCLQALQSNANPAEEMSQLIERSFSQKVQKINFRKESSGWTMDLHLAGSKAGFLRLMKFSDSFIFNYRQNEKDIEAIANFTLDNQCQSLSDARFVFFNANSRPAVRVKVNSFLQVVQKVPMEEPVRNLEFKKITNESSVRVGLIDSGIDYNHPSLIEKTRPMLGIDLTNPQRPPFDYTNTVQNELMGRHFSHGSAVADLASRGVQVLLIPVRTENQVTLDGEAVEYLAKKNVRIVNISQGTLRESDWLPFKQAALRHPEMLFIVAAGNEGQNVDEEPTYPSAFDIPNMLVVASVDSQNQLSKFSNYGAKHVHVAALGENVSAALAGGGAWTVNGTSFAAPLVTNLAARLLEKNPELTATQLREKLIQKAKPLKQLQGLVRFGVLSLD